VQIRVREVCREVPFSLFCLRIFENPSRICLLDKPKGMVLAPVVVRKRGRDGSAPRYTVNKSKVPWRPIQGQSTSGSRPVNLTLTEKPGHLYVAHPMVISRHRIDTASERSARLSNGLRNPTHLAHAGLTPHTSVRPSLQSQFIVALFPDENSPRVDIHRPLDLVETTCNRLEQALSYGLENGVCIARITDVQPVVCWLLHGKVGCRTRRDLVLWPFKLR
jgi:hypothetical protein